MEQWMVFPATLLLSLPLESTWKWWCSDWQKLSQGRHGWFVAAVLMCLQFAVRTSWASDCCSWWSFSVSWNLMYYRSTRRSPEMIINAFLMAFWSGGWDEYNVPDVKQSQSHFLSLYIQEEQIDVSPNGTSIRCRVDGWRGAVSLRNSSEFAAISVCLTSVYV